MTKTLRTERLTLAPLDADDLDDLATMFEHREVWEYEYERGLSRSETQAFLERQLRLWSEHGFGGYRVCTGGTFIGVVGLGVPTIAHEAIAPVTIGWRLDLSAWGHGYATEAARALLEHAFTTLDFERVSCVTGAENQRSLALARRIGMTETARTTVRRDDDRGWAQACILERTRSGAVARPPARNATD